MLPGADPMPFVSHRADGTAALTLLVDGIHCAGCVNRIERTLTQIPGVLAARVNLTTKRLSLRWRESAIDARQIGVKLADLGYAAVPFDADAGHAKDSEEARLLRALAVAGFASANVMLLSVATWAGAFGEMGAGTRGLLHWVSALIVLPSAAYAVRPFLSSAVAGLKRGEMRMDLPIAVGVLMTLAMSLSEAVRNGPYVYFDAAASLLFFLLVGRVLDRLARSRASAAAENLLVLRGATATVIAGNGDRYSERVENLAPGMVVLVAAGDRVPADGMVETGHSDIDTSLITGETVPRPAHPGARVFAGTVNRTGPLTVSISAAGEGTLLSDIVRLMEAAVQSRARLVGIADRAARIYAPAVHLAALAAFLWWWGVLGAGWQQGLLIAVSVLIITCPCGLGLAVPVVQVVASGRLLRNGILLKASDGLERLAAADTVVFDKTGTLTLGSLTLHNAAQISAPAFALAASIAAASRHPLCQALVRCRPDARVPAGISEHPGEGLSLVTGDGEVRLGSRRWCGVTGPSDDTDDVGPELWLARPGGAPVRFTFEDTLRADAAATVAALRKRGLHVEILSGDRPAVVDAVARAAGIDVWRAGCRPGDKIARLQELAAAGRKVLMVGDGLNDAPSLAAAHVSMSPATAADISQAAADFIFQGDRLAPVLEALRVARTARRLMLQNFALSAVYNVLAVPFAVAGLVTPLIAAVAMSASSLAVILNALRLNLQQRRTP